MQEACEKIYKEPDSAINLSTSTLETIIKQILEENIIKDKIQYDEKDGLYRLTQKIIKAFDFSYNREEIESIGYELLEICQKMGQMRNKYTKAHGKSKSQTIIDEPMIATLLVNSVVTVGLFLLDCYEEYKKDNTESN